MDFVESRPMCWEITGCGSQDDCKVWQLVKSTGKPCWDVVKDFDDYRSALNVCGDCIVSVLSKGRHVFGESGIEDVGRVKADNASHHSCPGVSSSS